MSTSNTPHAVSTSSASSTTSTWSASATYEHMYDALATGIADHGVRAYEDSLAAFAGRASQVGLSPTLIEVVVDRSAPEPVRQRAFGLLALRLAAVERTTHRPSIFELADRDAA